MKKNYKFKLPKDTKVQNISVNVKDGDLLIDVEFEEKFEPKDGDFLYDNNYGVFIYNGNQGEVNEKLTLGAYIGETCRSIYTRAWSNKWTYKDTCRYATEQEKADFLERLEKEHHKRWNAETKLLEDIRWRPKEGEKYWYVDRDGEVVEVIF